MGYPADPGTTPSAAAKELIDSMVILSAIGCTATEELIAIYGGSGADLLDGGYDGLSDYLYGESEADIFAVHYNLYRLRPQYELDTRDYAASQGDVLSDRIHLGPPSVVLELPPGP